MTVGTTARIIEYAGDDSATPRAVPFYFLGNDDLRVTRVNADASEDVLVRGTDYSVAGAGDPSGGSVTPLAAIASGTSWRIEGAMLLTQPADYTPGDDFPAETHERALDRTLIGVQETRRDLDQLDVRTPSVPRGSVAPDLVVSDLAEGDILTFRGGKLQRLVREPFAGMFYAGGAGGELVPAAGTGGGDDALRGDLANAAAGAKMVQSLVPFTATVARSLDDRLVEARSVLEWFTAAQKAAARNGDLSLDMTAAIQSAFDSGVPVLDMHDYAYRIDGTDNLPTAGIKLTGKGWSAQRGAGVVNNGGKMFSAVSATGLIEIENGTLTGNVDRLGVGYDSFASGIWLEDCAGGAKISNMTATGFSVGLRPQYCEGFTVIGGEYTANILGGISGMANAVLIDGADVYANGYSGSSGQSHDIYIINGKGGVIRNCYIGDPVDATSDSLALRYDESDAQTGFDDLTDWRVYSNRFNAGGARVSSDPGVAVANRKPPSNVRVFNNVFSGGADLRFDDPQACKTWGNRGIDRLIVAVQSSWPGYVIGFVSDDDECVRVDENALSAKRIEASTAVIFKKTTINNGASTAFNEISGLGGLVACTILDQRILGTAVPFDTAALSRYTNIGGEVIVSSPGSLRHMDRRNETVTSIGSVTPWTPANHTADDRPFLIGRIDAATATIGPPAVAARGMPLRLMLQQNYATGTSTITFDSSYKLTTNTVAAIAGANAVGQYIELEFYYINGAWRQQGDASWTAA